MIVPGCSVETSPQGRELIAHGSALMPVACYYNDLSRYPVPWHWHEELEAGVVLAGEACVFVGSQRLTVRAGDGFFINTGVLHGAVQVGQEVTVIHSLVFHPRLVGGSVDSVFWGRYLLPLMECRSASGILLPHRETWSREAAQCILRAWDAGAEEAYGYEFAMRESLSRMVLTLCAHMPGDATRPSAKALRDNQRIKQMLAYIQTHYAEEITVEAVAASASVSKSECLRCFRSVVNTTPIQYVRQYRLQRAAELLASTGQPVAEIAGCCGFQEMSYFSRAFRAYKGLSPTAYRQSLPASIESSPRRE